jgi:hypothetical protein
MRHVILLGFLILSTVAFAQTAPEPVVQPEPPAAAIAPAGPEAPVEPAPPAAVEPAAAPRPAIDEHRLAELATNVKAVQRVITLSSDLKQNRQVITAMVDEDIEALREPRDNGTYRWASLQREEDSRVTAQKEIEMVHSEEKLNSVSVSGKRAFRVQVDVPKKQSTFRTNNRVWIRDIAIEWTSFGGETTRTEVPVGVWVNPGDGHGVALPDIAKSAQVVVSLGVETGSKKAVADVSVLQAKLVDDPKAPHYPLITRLLDIRRQIGEKDPRRGDLKSSVDEAVLIIPGEMKERVAEYAAATEERKAIALKGVMKQTIDVGDATPDVTFALSEVSTLLGGSLEQQNEGRTKLLKLIETLTPKAAAETPAP